MAATATKERPIVFSGPMVRAILDGSKTMTRRIVKLPRGCEWYDELGGREEGWYCHEREQGWWHVEEMACPYGGPGERLWVRESWTAHWSVHPCPAADKALTSGERIRQSDGSWATATKSDPLYLYYRATFGDRSPMSHLKWRPSIHMPRWASRLTLELTAVRVERLQDISEADAVAEGCVRPVIGCALDNFYRLWDEINGEGSWQANPWVFVLSFTRVD